MKLVSAVLLLTLWFAADAAVSDQCLNGTDYVAWTQCLITHPECSDCSSGNYNTTSFPTTKQQLENITCPLVNCCSSCAAVALPALQCTFDIYCSAGYPFQISNCTLNCDTATYPYQDKNVTLGTCETETRAFYSCIIGLGSCTSNCSDYYTGKNLTSFADECGFYNDYYCTFSECCPGCATDLQAMEQCLVNQSISNCSNLDCTGFTLPPSTSTVGNNETNKSPTSGDNSRGIALSLGLYVAGIVAFWIQI